MFLLCFIVSVSGLLKLLLNLVKIAQLQLDWDYLECTLNKHDSENYSELFVFANELFIYTHTPLVVHCMKKNVWV